MLTITQAGISCKWTSDSQRFLLEHFDTINDSPSHIYHSALPFSPPSSWLHKCYSAELPPEVKVVKGLPAGWGRCSRILDRYTSVLSYCNNTIAVISGSRIIGILDSITGDQIATLSGHTGCIYSLAFSSDGKLLVSGSDDKTVKLWDVQTGGVVKTFCGHTSWVRSVSISADCTRIASGSSGDDSIRLWNAQTEECYCVIQQKGVAFKICFSPKSSQHILSISNDKVWQWDINGHQAEPIYDGSHFAFSSNSAQLVLCKGPVVKVQDSSSGVAVAEFFVANGDIKYCCFCPDDKLVAAAAGGIVYVWDISSEPHIIETLIGHTDDIASLTFSSPSSLISASYDRSVRFWQIGTPDPAMANQNPTPPTLAAIQSIALQAEDRIIITSHSDGVVRTWDISTGLCKASF